MAYRDQAGDVIDRFHLRRDQHAAERFFRRLLRGREITISDYYRQTQKLFGLPANGPMRLIIRNVTPIIAPKPRISLPAKGIGACTSFKSAGQAQRFLCLRSIVLNLFRVGRHLLLFMNYRLSRLRSFAVWRTVTAA